MATLRDRFNDLDGSEYCEDEAYKYLDVEVVREYHETPWIGRHKNVHVWVLLANGRAVGWNENPATGWYFPVQSVFRKPKYLQILLDNLEK